MLLLIGRFHPLVLHFPIVLILLALVFELINRFGYLKEGAKVIGFVLAAASLSVVVVVVAGYLLYTSGEYTGDLVMRHFWGGVFSGAGILTTTLFFLLDQCSRRRLYTAYFVLLVLTNIGVVYTSHLGGSLTHGKDYLTEYLPLIFGKGQVTGQKPIEEMLVYQDLIVPFLETKCVSCHNEHKTKGGLLMTSYTSLLQGGESGQPAITKGNPEQSALYLRVSLPPDHEDHMPPEGKKPLSNQEIALLKYWITAGASNELPVGRARENPAIDSVIQSYLPESIRLSHRLFDKKQEKEQLKQELAQLAEKLQVSIEEDMEAEGNGFILSMRFPPAPFGSEQLQEMQPYLPFFTKVSLVSSDITDDDLYFVGKMINLRQLYLQKVDLNGSGLIYLQNLQNLETLNLSFTETENAAALELIKFPVLKKVYLFDTPVSEELVKALRKNRADWQILLEEGPYR